MSKKWKNNDIIGSADAQRWEDKPNAQDLVNLKNTIESGNVKTADKLKTARKIALTGNATGSAFFDGSKDVNVSVSVSSASIKNKGLVQLTNDLSSNSEQLAPTAKSVKYLNAELSKKADKSVAQMFKLTRDKGYSHYIANDDCNNFVTCGFRYAILCKNSPVGSGGSGFLIITSASSQYTLIQMAVSLADGTFSYRRKLSGKWKIWQQLATEKDLSKKADIDKAQMSKLTLDNGYSLRMDTNDANECINSGFYYLTQPVKNGFDGERGIFVITNGGNSEFGFQIGVAQATGQIAKRWQVGGKWRDWVQLATADKAQMYKLTRDTGDALTPPTKNLANLREPGYYMGTGFKDSPFPEHAWLFVEVFKDYKTNMQRITDVYSNTMAHRCGNLDRGWTAWKKY